MLFETISARNVGKYVNKDKVLLIDLRSRESYKLSRIYNSINVPYSRIDSGDFFFPKDYKLVLYCERGGKSFSAARILSSMGFPVVAVVGGMQMYFDS